jgi:hypothetical protein
MWCAVSSLVVGEQTMVIGSGGSGGADCDVDSRKVVDSGREVGCRDAARSGCAMGWGWVDKEDNGLGLGDC